jgi:hypothetical protein
MPQPFLELTLEQFADLLNQYPWKRRVTEIHLHHTWRPNHSDFFSRPPIQTIEAMFRFHTTQQGLSDLAQHITIDPQGQLWTGRHWNVPPASAAGFNGNATAGPFMVSMIGDFDENRDKWQNKQRDAAIEVIARVQKLWGLPPEAVRFHKEMMLSKSCPGSSLRKEEVLELVKRVHDRLAVPDGRSAGVPKERGTTEQILQLFNVNPVSRAISNESELPESAMTLDDITALNAPPGSKVSRATDDSDLTAEDFKLLRAHVVNLRMGALSSGGKFQTTEADLHAIFSEHLPAFMEANRKLRLVFFAHGGLNGEVESLKNARNRIAFYKANNCYPIFFIWETGVLETLTDIFGEISGFGTGRDITESITNLTDSGFESLTRNGGFAMWRNMKLSAERAFLPRQGGTLFVNLLTSFWRDHSANMEIHAIGHSAGSIFHAYFLNLLCSQPSNPPLQVKTLHFLAPAITVDLFKEQLVPLIGGRIAKLTEYTMSKDFELQDDVGKVYRKSLLYLVSRAFEDAPETPILGLEESIRRDPDMIRFFGLLGKKPLAEILFSVQQNGPSHSTISKTHGDFDNDRFTMGSVMRRMLDVKDDEQIIEFPETVSRALVDFGERLALKAKPAAKHKPGEKHEVETAPSPVIHVPSNGGRKIALCIGIDDYPSPYRLSGCVNDAKAWAKTLTSLGFETQTMMNEQADWEGIRSALSSLVSRTRPGDVVVVQYAGHGTRVKDLDNDEPSGRDSAVCPVNFNDGKFLVDDDVREIFQKLPDGVNLTCFFDCCHSGTITRLVAPTPVKPAGDVRVRGFRADDAMEQAHSAFRTDRRRSVGIRTIPASRGPAGMREISFSACTDSQTAQEIDGHGQFTVRALKIIGNGMKGLTNSAFRDKVLAAFGSDAVDQTPGLDCSPASKNRLLLAPFDSI